MSNYNDILAELKAKNRAKDVDGKAPRSRSKEELTTLAHALLNDTEYEVTEYSLTSKDEAGNPVKHTSKPQVEYRNSLKPMLKDLGLDKADIEKIDTLELNKKQAAAVVNLGTHVIKDHISSGRKMTFPTTSMDEAGMSISVVPAPEKITVGNRFAKTPEDQAKTSIIKERDIIKVKNQTPWWKKEVK